MIIRLTTIKIQIWCSCQVNPFVMKRPYGVQWTMYVVENNWKTPFIPKGENVAIKFLIVQQFRVMLIENYPK